jgi:hypothetical protein
MQERLRAMNVSSDVAFAKPRFEPALFRERDERQATRADVALARLRKPGTRRGRKRRRTLRPGTLRLWASAATNKVGGKEQKRLHARTPPLEAGEATRRARDVRLHRVESREKGDRRTHVFGVSKALRAARLVVARRVARRGAAARRRAARRAPRGREERGRPQPERGSHSVPRSPDARRRVARHEPKQRRRQRTPRPRRRRPVVYRHVGRVRGRRGRPRRRSVRHLRDVHTKDAGERHAGGSGTCGGE